MKTSLYQRGMTQRLAILSYSSCARFGKLTAHGSVNVIEKGVRFLLPHQKAVKKTTEEDFGNLLKSTLTNDIYYLQV